MFSYKYFTMSSESSRLEKVLFWSVIGGFAIHQSGNMLKIIGSNVLRLFFHKIEIPLENNPILFPKIQMFLNKKAIGGSEIVVENGNDKIRTGCMLTVFPFSMVYVKYLNKQTSISIFLNRWRQRTDVFLEYLDRMCSNDNSISFYTLTSPTNDWQKAKTLERTTIPSLYTDQMIETLDNNVSQFLRSAGTYRKLGKTHKFTMLLYGPNGTGKTFCAKWLAMKYGRDVYVVDPSHYFCDMGDLQKRIVNSTVLSPCQGGILLFEDVDRYFATLYAKQQRPNISNFLNLLDGLCTPENIMIILTANYRGDIPDSIRRDGRIDMSMNFPYVDDEIKGKICSIHGVNSDQVRVENKVTTSELIKRIELSKSELNEGKILLVSSETNELPRDPSTGSISILNN